MLFLIAILIAIPNISYADLIPSNTLEVQNDFTTAYQSAHAETTTGEPSRVELPTRFTDPSVVAKTVDVETNVVQEEVRPEKVHETPVIAPALSVANRTVPFYSQFKDISSPKWKKVGCGIASLAMIIEYYNHDDISVNELLQEGISAGAYLDDAGWIHKGLIDLSKVYGLVGETYDYKKLSYENAYAEITRALNEGPVIASVHYEFDPQSTIPHLVVINRIEGELVYYNDPAAKKGDIPISKEKFLAAWKKRFIVMRPVQASATLPMQS